MWTLPPADRLALREHLPAAQAALREIANGFEPTTAAAIREHVTALTGSADVAEATVLRWREARLEAGLDVV